MNTLSDPGHQPTSASELECMLVGGLQCTQEQVRLVPCAQNAYQNYKFKDGLYRIWCGANRLGDSGVHTLRDNSAFVNPGGQLLLPGGVRPEWILSA